MIHKFNKNKNPLEKEKNMKFLEKKLNLMQILIISNLITQKI